MKIPFLRLADPAFLPEYLKGAVVAIGNFDGVHCGHQAVLQAALDQAQKYSKPAIVLTFEPHPRTVFNPSRPMNRLTPAMDKAEIFRLLGFDAVIEQAFTCEFAACTAEAFVNDILSGLLGGSGVVTGDNFHFGYKRQGSPVFLQQAGKRFAFRVRVVDALRDKGGEVVSSSRIRALLGKGGVEKAAELLGYRYTISAKVVHGAALGRRLGFPTANVVLASQVNLAFGIYAVRFRRANGRIYDGVASFGCRPTVNETAEPLLETCVFDFSADLYDENCSVSFFSFLREEKKFDGFDPLIAQMHQDEAEARAVLAEARPLSLLDRHVTFENRV